MDTLRSKNCKIAFSTEPKNFTKSNDPLSIPRYGLSHGNKAFLNTKLILGEYWYKLKSLRGKNERNERIEFNKLT